jgi:hypothetical protein
MKSEMLQWLRDYIKETPAQQIQKEWQEIESLGLEGPNAFDYFDFLEYVYCPEPDIQCYNDNIKLSNKKTLMYSGSFFFTKFVL